MLRPQGYAQIIEPVQIVERDTASCGHCNRVIFVKPGTATTVYLIQHRDGHWTEEPGAFCRVCMRPVCLRCHDIGTCVPVERLLERLEAR